MKNPPRDSSTMATAVAVHTSSSSPSRLFRSVRWGIGAILLGAMPWAKADLESSASLPAVDVITVTSMTEAGRTYPAASRATPVYYMIIDLGQQTFGRSWAGEQTPPKGTALKWMMQAMAQQGYRLADNQHRPTQLFVYSWGLLQGGPDQPARKFFGIEDADLIAGPGTGAHRTGASSIVLDVVQGDFFLGMVRSFDMESYHSAKKTLLWETRFGCPAHGLALDEVMPLIIKAAAANLGRETQQPVFVDTSTLVDGRPSPAVQRKRDYESLLADQNVFAADAADSVRKP